MDLSTGSVDFDNSIIQRLMTSEINNQQIKLVMEEGIEMVLNDMNPDKASGPNGFLTFFFQIFCDHIKDEVVHAVQHFFSSGMLSNFWNRIYIASIPKKENPSHLNDFWPINLLNFIYKIVAKILVKQL